MWFSAGLFATKLNYEASREIFASIGITDVKWLVVIAMGVNAYNIILLRNGFAGVPTEIEEAAFAAGGGNYCAPAQKVGDFLAGRASQAPGEVMPTYRPGVTWCDLRQVLPVKITNSLQAALPQLEDHLKGFSDSDAVLTAPETRSSSPVRILRGEDKQSLSLRGLYPCGEGAGYAGGIMSAAIDGMQCAEAILSAI